MCRIGGIVDQRKSSGERSTSVAAMMQLMQSGGPDGDGIFTDDTSGLTLGHRRLAILDLTEAGHQPMIRRDGQLALTYNGEIYNFRELRQELAALGYPCSTQTDTEVILQAYACWGKQGFRRLEGMFAFALWDASNQQLWLVRDAEGIKPLYLATWDGGGLAFASTVKALKLLPDVEAEHPAWPVLLLAYGHLPGSVTTCKHIEPVEPGTAWGYHVVTGNKEVYSIRSSPTKQYTFHQKGEALDALRETMQQVLARDLYSDAPIGLFLSGGIDSSILAISSSEIRPDIHTSAVFFQEEAYSESRFQDLVRSRIPQGKHLSHAIGANDFFSSLAQIQQDSDLPSCDGINTWFIAKFAREEGLKAVLSGLGADEYWGGYPSFKRMKWVDWLSKFPADVWRPTRLLSQKAFRRLVFLRLGGRTGAYLFLRGLFVPQDIARILHMTEQEVWEILSQYPRNESLPTASAFDTAALLETKGYMRDQLLRDSDVMGMAHGLEIRVPFLDPLLTDLASQIPAAWKEPTEYAKPMLIDAFKDKLPVAVWQRPKMGFTFPFDEWFRHDERSKAFFADLPGDYHRQFLQGQLHWSQLYTLSLLKGRIYG